MNHGRDRSRKRARAQWARMPLILNRNLKLLGGSLAKVTPPPPPPPPPNLLYAPANLQELYTAWCMKLVLWRHWVHSKSGACSDDREPISLHQAEWGFSKGEHSDVSPRLCYQLTYSNFASTHNKLITWFSFDRRQLTTFRQPLCYYCSADLYR